MSSKIAQLHGWAISLVPTEKKKNHLYKTYGFTEFVWHAIFSLELSWNWREKETIFVIVLFLPSLNFTFLKAYSWMNQQFVGVMSQAGQILLLFLNKKWIISTHILLHFLKGPSPFFPSAASLHIFISTGYITVLILETMTFIWMSCVNISSVLTITLPITPGSIPAPGLSCNQGGLVISTSFLLFQVPLWAMNLCATPRQERVYF